MSALDSPWIEVCPIDSIPLRGCRVVRTRHMQIALFRTASDEVSALENRCPHKNGPLSEGIVHDRKVTCPLVVELALYVKLLAGPPNVVVHAGGV